jgi:hypothetical protein
MMGSKERSVDTLDVVVISNMGCVIFMDLFDRKLPHS